LLRKFAINEDISTITDLTLQKRNKERLNVFLDGAYAFSLAISIASGLSIGKILTPSDIVRLQTEDEFEKAKQSAYRFLSYRPRSAKEMERNLIRKGFDENTVERVIDRLLELELVDDRSFAQYWVEQREIFGPRGHRALRHELYQKGVNREIVDSVLINVDEEAAARRAGQKKVGLWSQLPKDDFFKKMSSFLQRRGFNYEIIKSVTIELWNTIEVDG
jgi:regulatory protein